MREPESELERAYRELDEAKREFGRAFMGSPLGRLLAWLLERIAERMPA